MIFALFSTTSGTRPVAVSYRGTPQAVTDLVGGHIEAAVVVEHCTYKNDPYMQLMDYLSLFKSGKTVKGRSGRVINGIRNNTSFHRYVVVDLNEGLLKRLRGRFQPTPDGRGRFGYTTDPDGYVEVVPCSKFLPDAQSRNAIFSRSSD